VPSAAEAERTRRDAAADLRKDGARVTIVFEGEGRTDPVTGVATPVTDRTVRTWALLTGYSLALVDGSNIQSSDLRAMLADAELPAALSAALDGGDASGWILYAGGNPARHPVPGAAGVRQLAIVAVEQTVYEGGWPVLRFLRARG
jgi:hypothetical protein